MRIALLLLLFFSSSCHAVELLSYLCLKWNELLCFGVSGGPDPQYDSNALLPLQMKLRERLQAKGLTYQKSKWDWNDTTGEIRLANKTQLCLTKQMQNVKNNKITVSYEDEMII